MPDVPEKVLGKTNQLLSLIGLNASGISAAGDEQTAIALIRDAIEMDGATPIDMTWDSSDGYAEGLVGEALKGGHRSKAFLTIGITGIGKKACMNQLEGSLRRLQTDVIDLWVFHESIYRQGPDNIFSLKGGIAAATEARATGKVRYIGFTGYEDHSYFHEMVHRYFEWDAVVVPIDGLDFRYQNFKENIMPMLLTRNIGLIAVNAAGAKRGEQHILPPEKIFPLLWSDLFTTVAAEIDSRETLQNYARIAESFRTMPEDQRKKLLEHLSGLNNGGGKR